MSHYIAHLFLVKQKWVKPLCARRIRAAICMLLCFLTWSALYIWNAAVIQIQNLAYENLIFKFSWKLKFIHKLLGYIHILIIKLSPTFFLPFKRLLDAWILIEIVELVKSKSGKDQQWDCLDKFISICLLWCKQP